MWNSLPETMNVSKPVYLLVAGIAVSIAAIIFLNLYSACTSAVRSGLESANKIKLNIKELTGKTFQYSVFPNDKVQVLIKKFVEGKELSESRVKLQYAGKILDPNTRLCDHNIVDSSTLHLLLR